MPISDFYATDGPTLFIDRMAAFLGIPNDKMRIVSIVEGSVIIDYEITMDETTKASPVVASLSTPASTDSSSTATSSSSCGGVSSGIAAALASGALNLGGTVSDMSYSCSKVIESDAAYTATVAESTNSSSSAGGGTLIAGGV